MHGIWYPGAGPSFPPDLTPEGALPLSLRFLERQGGTTWDDNLGGQPGDNLGTGRDVPQLFPPNSETWWLAHLYAFL